MNDFNDSPLAVRRKLKSKGSLRIIGGTSEPGLGKIACEYERSRVSTDHEGSVCLVS